MVLTAVKRAIPLPTKHAKAGIHAKEGTSKYGRKQWEPHQQHEGSLNSSVIFHSRGRYDVHWRSRSMEKAQSVIPFYLLLHFFPYRAIFQWFVANIRHDITFQITW